MAEARILSDYEEIENQPITVVQHEQKPQDNKKRKLKTSTFYRLVYVILGLVMLVSIFFTIHMQNSLTKTSVSIMNQQQDNKKIEQRVEELRQEKNELSRADRIMTIAKEAGLVVNDNNIRKVMK